MPDKKPDEPEHDIPDAPVVNFHDINIIPADVIQDPEVQRGDEREAKELTNPTVFNPAWQSYVHNPVRNQAECQRYMLILSKIIAQGPWNPYNCTWTVNYNPLSGPIEDVKQKSDATSGVMPLYRSNIQLTPPLKSIRQHVSEQHSHYEERGPDRVKSFQQLMKRSLCTPTDLTSCPFILRNNQGLFMNHGCNPIMFNLCDLSRCRSVYHPYRPPISADQIKRYILVGVSSYLNLPQLHRRIANIAVPKRDDFLQKLSLRYALLSDSSHEFWDQMGRHVIQSPGIANNHGPGWWMFPSSCSCQQSSSNLEVAMYSYIYIYIYISHTTRRRLALFGRKMYCF